MKVYMIMNDVARGDSLLFSTEARPRLGSDLGRVSRKNFSEDYICLIFFQYIPRHLSDGINQPTGSRAS